MYTNPNAVTAHVIPVSVSSFQSKFKIPDRTFDRVYKLFARRGFIATTYPDVILELYYNTT